MLKRGGSLVMLLLVAAGCRTVVTSTTELRPSRYAVTEFMSAVTQDSFLVVTKRAISAEGLEVQREDRSGPSVTTRPLAIPASGDQPALDAVVVVSLETRGSERWIRVLASALLAEGQMGGRDARLAALVQRLRQRVEMPTDG